MVKRTRGNRPHAKHSRSRLLASFARYAMRTPGAGALKDPAVCGGIDWRTVRFAGDASEARSSSSQFVSADAGKMPGVRRLASGSGQGVSNREIGVGTNCYAHVRDRHAFDPSLDVEEYAKWMLPERQTLETGSGSEDHHGDLLTGSCTRTRVDSSTRNRVSSAVQMTPLPRQRVAATELFAKEYVRLGGHRSTMPFQRTLRQYILENTPPEINSHARNVATAAANRVVTQDTTKSLGRRGSKKSTI